jgi:hypothetical protein
MEKEQNLSAGLSLGAPFNVPNHETLEMQMESQIIADNVEENRHERKV